MPRPDQHTSRATHEHTSSQAEDSDVAAATSNRDPSSAGNEVRFAKLRSDNLRQAVRAS